MYIFAFYPPRELKDVNTLKQGREHMFRPCFFMGFIFYTDIFLHIK